MPPRTFYGATITWYQSQTRLVYYSRNVGQFTCDHRYENSPKTLDLEPVHHKTNWELRVNRKSVNIILQIKMKIYNHFKRCVWSNYSFLRNSFSKLAIERNSFLSDKGYI